MFWKLSIKKTQLGDLLGVKVQGTLVRSCFQSIAIIYLFIFLNLEKKNRQKRFIHALHSETGILLSNLTEICRRAVCFYEKLKSSEYVSGPGVDSAFSKTQPRCRRRPRKA